jgi:hypothetical protein
MEVPLFFPVSTVAQMLGQVSEKFIERELARGRFFPIDGEAIDRTTVMRIAGKDMVSLVGVQWYLRQHCAWPRARAAAGFLAKEMSSAPDLVSLPDGVPARSEGELRRKLAHG